MLLLPSNQASSMHPLQDPNAPKRGLSAFMFFSNAKRTEVRQQLFDGTLCLVQHRASPPLRSPLLLPPPPPPHMRVDGCAAAA